MTARGKTEPAGALSVLQERLAQALEAARQSWPDIPLEGSRFAAHLARLVPADGHEETWGRLHMADVYLARAAADGLPSALATFEQRLMPEVDTAVARLKLPPAGLDEVRQALRQRMLVG
ncbi:transcriptional regulator, partial [Corallococcus sp. 4LFB]